MHKNLIGTTALAVAFANLVLAEPVSTEKVLQGVTFQIESPNDSSLNQVTLRASTLEGSLGQIQAEADGSITDVEVGDLNADGYPEIYVFVTSAGSGSYGSLIAYASNRNKSLSEIYLPPIDDSPALSKGYMGHDTFTVGKGVLVRRFPVYLEGDNNAEPTGGTRQIDYTLEAGWVLRQGRVVGYLGSGYLGSE